MVNLGHQPDCEPEARALECAVVEIRPWIQRGNIAGKRRGPVLNMLEFFIQPTDGKFGI